MGIFGGGSKSSEKSHQETGNRNLGLINDLFSGTAGTTGVANQSIMDMLQGTDRSSFDNFRANTGYQDQMDQGISAIQNSAFSGGAGNSGSTMKALTRFGQGLANQSYQGYMDNLFKQGQLGLGAGALLGDAGKYSVGDSSGSSSKKNGLGAEVGGIGSVLGFLSDRSAKEDIVLLEEIKPGLNLYEFTYKTGGPRMVGVMADEVSKTYPEALGPMQGDYQTVNYSKLAELINA